MDDLAVADVHGHVVDLSTAVAIEDQVSGPHLAGFDPGAPLGLVPGIVGQGNAEMLHH